jgi:hypothetical protein
MTSNADSLNIQFDSRYGRMDPTASSSKNGTCKHHSYVSNGSSIVFVQICRTLDIVANQSASRYQVILSNIAKVATIAENRWSTVFSCLCLLTLMIKQLGRARVSISRHSPIWFKEVVRGFPEGGQFVATRCSCICQQEVVGLCNG